MKNTVNVFLFLFLVALTGATTVYAEEPDLVTQEGEAGSVTSDDGSPKPVELVDDQDDSGESDPSSFTGDSENMPGEKAPENLPMDDAPVDAGVGI